MAERSSATKGGLSVDYAILLAAGEGTRMKSSLPKVLHQVLGKSLLHRTVAALPAELSHLVVVVGAGSEAVSAALASIAPDAQTIFQATRGGTGHATRLAMSVLEKLENFSSDDRVLVLGSDTALLRPESIQKFIDDAGNCDAAVLTANVPNPFGYGRIVRNKSQEFISIVEEKDANLEEKQIFEVNSGIYLFKKSALISSLSKLSTSNAQSEEYLTDAISILKNMNSDVKAFVIDDFREILGINDRVQLSECGAILRDRVNEDLMKQGVTIIDPASTWIEEAVVIAPDVTILPGCTISGKTSIATGAIIGPRTTLVDCVVGEKSVVRESTCEGAVIGTSATVGPYSYLRPGTILGQGAKAGAFVEIKNSEIGPDSKVPHLSYVGDATIGTGSNIGAATVFVNYDGIEKHQTVVGDHVRIGSDTMLVAPVSIGDGAYTAAGSVITEDVPAGAMGVGRARQRNILDWVLRKRPGSRSAEAAKKQGKN